MNFITLDSLNLIKMKNIQLEFKWAIIFTVMMLLWMVAENQLGFHGDRIALHSIVTNFVAIPAILIFVFALREKRKITYNGKATYIQLLVSGAVLSIIITCLTPMVQYLINVAIAPEYFINMKNYVTSTGAMTKEAAEEYFNPLNYMIEATIGSFGMGIITSAIVAIFLKAKATT